MEYELYHHGVKGMKWGVRRSKRQLGYKESAKKKIKTAKEKVKEIKSKKKSVKDMTDSELKERIARLELEKRFNDLSPKKVSLGKRFVSHVGSNILAPALTDVGKQVLKSGLVHLANTKIKIEGKPLGEISDGSLRIFTNNKKK